MKKLFIPLFGLALVVMVLYFFQSGSKVLLPNLQKILPSTNVSQPTNTTNYQQPGISLEISSPKDGAVVNLASVIVKGKTSPGADVFVNNLELKSDAQGNFSQPLVLDEGANTVVVVVNDASGNSAEKDITINLETLQ